MLFCPSNAQLWQASGASLKRCCALPYAPNAWSSRLLRPWSTPCLPVPAHSVQAVSSTLICMPQHRNTANRIFGGFLMHRAYEVGFCAAFMFGGSRPRFSEIDEVCLMNGALDGYPSVALYDDTTWKTQGEGFFSSTSGVVP